MKNQLEIKGKTNIQGLEFIDIEGGFEEDRKAILVKDIADIHKRPVYKLNERINLNKEHFKKYVDYIDLKKDAAIFLKDSKIFTQGSINASKNIYLLSERGYLKLVKILEDPKAWEVYNILLDDYFNLRKEKKELSGMDLLSNLNMQSTLMIKEMNKIENRVTRLEDDMTIETRKQQILSNKAKSRVLHYFGGKESIAYRTNYSLRSKVFAAIWKDYKDYIGVASYKDTPKIMYEQGLDFLETWVPSGKLLRELELSNRQLHVVK